MNRDPLEELFGQTSEHTQPVPARDRLAYEQGDRVRTAQLHTEPRSSARSIAAKPWIIVGAVAVLALIASILVVNLARGGGDGSEASTPAQTEAPATSEPTPTPSASETPKKEDPEEKSDEVPKVDVGATNLLDIPDWGVTSQLSSKFGMTSYRLEGNDLVLDSPLTNSLPEACADMRGAWGITKTSNGSFEVRKPATRCDAAPELYDELWGLAAAFAESVKPI